MTRSPNRATDFLIATARKVEATHGWTADHLADSDCADLHDAELNALDEAVADLRRARQEFTHYSDGRRIEACIEIEPGRGHYFHYVFAAPVEHRGERLLCEGARPADPAEGDRGRYQIFVDDEACTLRVTLTDPGPRLEVVR